VTRSKEFKSPIPISGLKIDNEIITCLKQPLKKDSIRFILCRHGETDHNEERKDHEPIDLEKLTTRGIAEANLVGKVIRKSGIQVDTIYSLDLRRCRQTAETIRSNITSKYNPINLEIMGIDKCDHSANYLGNIDIPDKGKVFIIVLRGACLNNMRNYLHIGIPFGDIPVYPITQNNACICVVDAKKSSAIINRNNSINNYCPWLIHTWNNTTHLE
tara:strand:- start:1440 stop:2087 length:648 start_codon:yes stop_codon:yes gene_type:complete